MKDMADIRTQEIQNQLNMNLINETPTLRDRFAMAAMTGLLADTHFCPYTKEAFAKCCYEYADAFLNARNK